MAPFPRAVLMSAVVIVVAGAVAAWWMLRDDGEQPADAGPAVQVTLAPGQSLPPTDPERPSRVPGDETLGDYDALSIPDAALGQFGMAEISDDVLTSEKNVPVGETFMYRTPLAGGSSSLVEQATLAVQVDDISLPLEGEERDRALERLGGALTDTTVQRVAGRVRAVGGNDRLATWNLMSNLSPVNVDDKLMPTSWDDTCSPSPTVFKGIDDVYDTTARFCFYVYGTVDKPTATISAVVAKSLLEDGSIREVWVPFDRWSDLMFDPRHDHDE